MATTASISQNQFNVYSSLLKSARDDVKLQLIAYLSNSLIKKKEIKKVDWANPFAGAWKDDRTTEEIIKDIRNSRTKNKEIEL